MADHDHDNEDFDGVSSGAAECTPMQCSALRKNGHVVIKDRPCKIVEMSTSKTGKHGHAKVHLVGIDLFTQKKYEDICPSTHNMQVPKVSRKEYECMSVDDDGFLSLMDETGKVREDLKCPENDLGADIRDKLDSGVAFFVVVLCSMGEELVTQLKAMT